MPIYRYKAKKTPSEVIQGTLEAESSAGAIAKLSEMGLFPVSIEKNREDHSFNMATLKISTHLLIFFTREMSDLMNSGVNLIQGLDLISEQSNQKRVQFLSWKISENVREGVPFSDSLKSFPQIFSPFYINIVKMGEMSGALEKVMGRLADFYEKNLRLKGKIIEAMAYPLFLILMGMTASIVLTIFVIPKLIPMYEDMNTHLPLITQIVIRFSNLISNFWQIALIILIVFILMFLRVFKSKRFKIKTQYFLLKLPIIGPFLACRYLSEIFQSMESLISNGVSVVQGLEITKESMDFYPYKETFTNIISDITNGKSFSGAIMETNIFPKKISVIIRVGEESGRMDQAMKKLSEYYTNAFEKVSAFLTKFAGPFFIIIIAIFIGFIVVAMLLPILNLNIAM